ncbi:MAG: hypothetical protein LBH48_04910 [Bifidobacteriaceae bacterium]|jgi:chromosome segregation ATPase|nr:hypothetical protein [Bifidobacteriaceae bacterium]
MPEPQDDLTYQAAAADRAVKIASLARELAEVQAEREELAKRVKKLERRLKRTQEKLEQRDCEIGSQRADATPAPPAVEPEPRRWRSALRKATGRG